MVADVSALEKAAGQTTGESNQLRFVLTVAGRRWGLILSFTLVGVLAFGVGGYLWFRTEIPANYVARAELVVQPSPWENQLLRGPATKSVYDSSPQALADRVPMGSLAEDVVRTMVQQDLAEGRVLADIATEDEYARQTAEVAGALTIEPFDRQKQIVVTGHGETQEGAHRMVDLAARIFIDRNHRSLLEGMREDHDFVLGQLDEYRVRLDESESALWALRKQMGYRTHDNVTQEMEDKSRQIAEAATTREEILAKMAGIEAQLKVKKEQLPTALGLIDSDVVTKLISEHNELWVEKVKMEAIYRPGVKDLRELDAEIAEKTEAILAAAAKLDEGASGATVWQDSQELRRQYMQLQLQLTALEIRTSTQEKVLIKMEESLPQLTEKSKAYQQLVRETNQLRDEYTRLLDAEFQIRTAIRRGTGQLERRGIVVSTASAGGSPERHWVNFLIGGLIGLAAGFGVALLLEWMDTSIRTIEEAAAYLGLEIIGTIPMMKFGKGRLARGGNYVPISDDEQVDACIVTQHDPKSPISEAYRTLRTNFQLATLQQKVKTVMVTSTVPGEGKTTTAVNMAVTFADSGLRTLIIDTDLRRPHVHHVLKMKRGPGLADVLREGLDHHTVVRKTSVQNLSIVSSGRVPPNPSELIGSKRMRELMDQLGNEFDIVVCDAPSLLVVTDPVLLSTDVDAVVLVVATSNARRETIVRGKQLLETARAKIAGVVLNGLEASRRHYYYYDDSSSRRRTRWTHI